MTRARAVNKKRCDLVSIGTSTQNSSAYWTEGATPAVLLQPCIHKIDRGDESASYLRAKIATARFVAEYDLAETRAVQVPIEIVAPWPLPSGYAVGSGLVECSFCFASIMVMLRLRRLARKLSFSWATRSWLRIVIRFTGIEVNRYRNVLLDDPPLAA